jgi:acyl carrier protein
MTDEQILTVLDPLIREFAELKEPDLNSSLSLKDDLGMDSLSRVDLVMKIERSFDISVADDVLVRFEFVGDVVEFIAENLPA